MPAITGIYNTLMATTAITDNLNTYRIQTGSPKVPAIFTSFEEPQDMTGPYIILSVPATTAGGNSEDRGHIAGLSIVDVVLYGPKSRSSKQLRDTAQLIWETLHRDEPADENYEIWILATPPSQLPDPEGFPGYVISCNATIRKIERSES